MFFVPRVSRDALKATSDDTLADDQGFGCPVTDLRCVSGKCSGCLQVRARMFGRLLQRALLGRAGGRHHIDARHGQVQRHEPQRRGSVRLCIVF